MLLSSFFLALSFAITASCQNLNTAFLTKRQTSSVCEGTDKVCGDGCVPFTYTCCPDGEGGCGITETCVLASNGIYGCCYIGETCRGPVSSATTILDIPTGIFSFSDIVATPSSFSNIVASSPAAVSSANSIFAATSSTVTRTSSTAMGTTTSPMTSAMSSTTATAATAGTSPAATSASVNAAAIDSPGAKILQLIGALALGVFI